MDIYIIREILKLRREMMIEEVKVKLQNKMRQLQDEINNELKNIKIILMICIKKKMD